MRLFHFVDASAKAAAVQGAVSAASAAAPKRAAATVPRQIEMELLRTTPRASRLRARTRTARVLMANALVGATLVGVWFASRDVRELHTLKREGIVRDGVVDSKNMRRGKSKSYTLVYHYETDAGTIADSVKVSSDRYFETEIGEPLTVTYLRANPEHHRVGRVDDERIASQQAKWTWWILGCALVLGGIFAWVESDFRKQLYLLRNGASVVARITKKRFIQGKTNTYYLKYRFSLTQNETRTTVTKKLNSRSSITQTAITEREVTVPLTLYNQMKEGDALTVLYDPLNVNRNLPYAMITAAEIT